MSTYYGIHADPDTIRSIDTSTFTGAYQAVGTPLGRPIRLIKFVNDSSVPVTLSWDGVHDHDYLPANSFTLFDMTTNEAKVDGLFVPEGTQFYAKGAAGTRSFYIVCIGAVS